MTVPTLPPSAVFDDEPQPDVVLAELVEFDAGATEPRALGQGVARTQRSASEFAIVDKPMAEWAMRRLSEATIRLDEDRRLYDQFVAQLDAWFARTAGPHLATIGFFTDHLEDYGRRWIAGQPPSRPRSLPLPSGVLKTTTRDQTVEVIDKDAALAWAVEHHPEIVNREVRVWVTAADVKKVVEIVVELDQDEEGGEIITSARVADSDTGLTVPGLGVKAKHVDVKVVPEPP